MIELLLNSSQILDVIQLYGYGVLFALTVSLIVYFISKKGIGEGDIILFTVMVFTQGYII